jgi:hypothetical protein
VCEPQIIWRCLIALETTNVPMISGFNDTNPMRIQLTREPGITLPAFEKLRKVRSRKWLFSTLGKNSRGAEQDMQGRANPEEADRSGRYGDNIEIPHPSAGDFGRSIIMRIT